MTVRSDAKFCSTRCRVYAARAAKRRVALPVMMTSRDRWMRWQLVSRRGRPTKLPVTVGGRSASSTDPSTWSPFETARASTVGHGLGFALGDGIGCIDLDHALEGGIVADWARKILDACPDTYVEVSHSGEGLHVFGLLAEGRGRNIRDGVRCVEVYSVGRYIAVTANRFEDAPVQLADLTELVSAI